MKHVDHMHFREASKRLIRLAVQVKYPKGRIIIVVGASRSGKSYLLDQLKNEIDQHASNEEWSPPSGFSATQRLPVISEEAFAPQKGTFSYDGLHEGFLDQLLPHRGHIMEKDKLKKIIGSMQIRGTKWMLIDEAHHLLAELNSTEKERKRMKNQMEALKNVVNKTKCVMVLFGGSELVKCVTLSEQLGARALVVPIRLYDPSTNKESEEFFDQAETLFQEYGISQDIWDDAEYMSRIMYRCCGSLGFLNESLQCSHDVFKGSSNSVIKDELASVMLCSQAIHEMVDNDTIIRRWIQENNDRDTEAKFFEPRISQPQGQCAEELSEASRSKLAKKRIGRKYDERAQCFT